MRFSSKLLGLSIPALILIVFSDLQAGPSIGLTDEDREMLNKSRQFQRSAQDSLSDIDSSIVKRHEEIEARIADESITGKDEEWLDNTAKLYKAIEQGDSLVDGFLGTEADASTRSKPETKRQPNRVDILVSEAMGQTELRVVTKMAMQCMSKEELPVRLVYQGVMDEDTIASFTQRQVGFLGAIKEGQVGQVPSVVIDIEPFEKYAKDQMVPVIIHYREGKEDSVKKGIINPCFDPDDPISAQASTLVKASETPMLSLIEERLAKIDWDKKKATVKDRYYARLPDPYLPPATEFKTRLVSMDVKVLQDIVMPNGEVVARRGEIINPLSVSPLYEHYLVINPRIKSQIDWAKKYITDNTDQQVVVMLDGAPEQKNPEGFASIEQQLRMPVYLLNDAVSERFHIRSTPTLIKQSDNTNIQVSEVALYE